MVEVGLATHAGRVRSHNEDYAYHGPTPHGYVGIVCDGMGGHEAGETAARLAAEAIYAFLTEAPPADPQTLLQEALLAANQRILLYGQQYPQAKNLGSTVVVTLLTDKTLFYAHIGDSRLYLYEKGKLSLLTQDDSLVQQMLSSGLISPQQALNHPQKNVLTQNLGQHPPPTPHIGQLPLPPKGLLLLCSDGLSNLLSLDEMQAILADPSPSLQQKADLLVEKANAQGGYDNITALLLAPPSKKANFALDMNLKLPPQKYLIGGGIALVALVLLILLFARKREAAPTAEKSDIIILTDDSTQVDTSLSSPPPLVEETGGEVITPSQGPMPVPSAPPTESPTVKPSRPTIAPSTPSSSSKTFTYTVQKGDNLTQIAKAFSVSREEVRRVNNLKDDDAIKAGQKLKIPVQALHTHTVGKGETLSAIARKYGTSTEAIRRANQIEDEKIRAGQKLTIPVVKK